MISDLRVKIGPQYYQYSEGAFDNIPVLLDEYNATNVLVVHGSKSWKKASPFLDFLNEKKYNFFYHEYTGECSYYGAELITEIVKERNINFIIGVGGGKLTDLVGYAGHLANVQYGVIPTLASNCAPWTPLAVMYKENGESEGKTEHYTRQAAFFITDPNLIIDSPVEYFVAGLADTIAKWYESDAILQQKHLKGVNFLNLAEYTSVLAKNSILNNAIKAVDDMKNGIVSDEFYNLSEIIFGVAGMVGGLGDKYARNAAAHAMHDGLGKYIPEVHNYLHGEIVAYGIFYQMALEERWEEIDKLVPFYDELELPKTLKDMNVQIETYNKIDDVVSFINSKAKVHLIPVEITVEKLKKAIYDLEKYF